MATTGVTPAQAELISSLSQDDIPIKLRCAICSKLAMNAFRLPCCEQAICENCQSSLPSSCPVCEHTPIAAEDCKPHKSLRTTIKVFLRTEEKKREASRAKALKDTPPVTPIEDILPPVTAAEELVPLLAPGATVEEPIPATEIETPTGQAEPENVAAASERNEIQQDVPQQSIEEIAPGQEQTADDTAVVEVTRTEEPEVAQAGETDANGQTVGMVGMGMPNPGMAGGLDATAMGGFPNMAMMGQGGDMNPMQMQMMMAMQNGMAPNTFGGFPMMGMPGMSMDPMAMQNMYMNGGFGGMGMNGMNMGMGGMTGFEGGAGAGFNGGWNGQQSWNVAQDNFNPNAAASAGMGHNDFGASNKSGYSFQQQRATGYNQGNYGRPNQYNDYSQGQGFYGRGRGRGRGGFGRGGYGHSDFSQQGNLQNGFAGPMSETGSAPTAPKESTNADPATNVDEFGREIRASSSAVVANNDEAATEKDDKVAKTEHDAETAQNPDHDQDKAVAGTIDTQHGTHQDEAAETENTGPKPIQTLEEIEQAQYGYQNGYGYQSGAYMNHNTAYNVAPLPPVDVPANAPTGPKAMREGLPNTSLVHLRGRPGYGNMGYGQGRASNEHAGTTSQEVGREDEDRGRTQGDEHDDDRARERSKSASKSRSRSQRGERRERHSHRRHRDASQSSDSREEERRRERRRRSRRDADAPSKDAEPVDGTAAAPATEAEAEERPRSQSPTESRRSTHRSRRDRDDRHRDRDRSRDKDRHRDRDSDRKDRDRDYKSSSHKHRSSRSHRDRSRDRDHERPSRRDRDRSRDRDRDSEREREHRHRRRRDDDGGDGAKPVETADEPGKENGKADFKPPSGPRAMTSSGGSGLEIRGAGARREPAREKRAEKTEVDPHTAEREARNRERLLKEAQRMAGLAGLVGGGGRKREREGEREEGGERKGKKSRGRGRFDGADEEEEGQEKEERARRSEREREGPRWA